MTHVALLPAVTAFLARQHVSFVNRQPISVQVPRSPVLNPVTAAPPTALRLAMEAVDAYSELKSVGIAHQGRSRCLGAEYHLRAVVQVGLA